MDGPDGRHAARPSALINVDRCRGAKLVRGPARDSSFASLAERAKLPTHYTNTTSAIEAAVLPPKDNAAS